MSRRGAAPEVVEIAGIRLTHPNRVLYPEQGITKRDLALYYQKVAPWILPHLAGRPLSLVRCPEGEGGSCFYQKHFAKGLPPGLAGVSIEEKDGTGVYAVVEDLPGLVALVQLGVLELHPWGAPARDIERPDRLIFDLDPDIDLPWERVVEAALSLREILAELALESFVKTTGGKGLHVVVPLLPGLDWETLKGVALAIAERLAATAPERYTVAMAKEARPGRIFIDYLRNSRGQTAIAPYSTRARKGAPVATPLSWREAASGKRPRFTIATVPRRLRRLARDPWEGMAEMKQSLGASVLRRLGL